MSSQTDTVAVDLDDTELETPPAGLFTRFAAEFLGTFILVFIGFGVTLYAGVLLNPDETLRLLSWGVALLVVIALFGRVSGGHFNPAVTLGAAITGRTSWPDVLVYWVGQLAGGAAAAGLLYLTIPSGLPTAVGAASQKAMFTKVASGYGEHSIVGQLTTGAVTTELVQVLLVEVVATALFVGVALMAQRWARGTRGTTAVVTGLAYGALSLTTYSLTGGALNPARATAAAIFSEGWAVGQLWLFWVAPLVGAAIAALLVTVFAPDPLPVYDLDDEDEDEEYAQEDATDADDEGHRLELEEDSEEPEEDHSAEDPTGIPEAGPARDDAFTEDYDATADYDEDDTGPARS
ncbi:MIP/aquaporin family protein [Ruania albidiflava]|uniref:MIP/aquaporin family protein n=1 Tax=Ruania albidiflava TaxID=366586 RepID=UPI0003B36461|nr:aquaporin [Ruania albidiflava]